MTRADAEPIGLTNGRWVPHGGILRWEPNAKTAWKPKRVRPETPIHALIACPTCRARVDETCKTLTDGRRRGPHSLRLVGRLCSCGESVAPYRQLCDKCARASLRQSKRDYMRRRRGTSVAA